MTDLRSIHAESYGDMPFEQFAQKYHAKNYADMPFDQFMAKAGGQPKVPTRAETVQSDYANQPWYAKAATAADDMLRLGVNGASFGFADKGFGLSSAEEVARQRQMTEDARIRSGGAGMVAEVGGGIGTGLGAIKAGATATRFIPQGISGGKRLAALAGAGAIDGAAMGAISGAGNTDDGNYLTNMGSGAAIGGIVGGAAPVAISGASRFAGALLNKPAPVPTKADLKQQAGRAYEAAERTGEVLPPQAMTTLRDKVRNKFTEEGYHSGLQPRASVVMSELDRLADQPVTLKGLEIARKLTNKAYDPINKHSNRLTYMARDAIDDLQSTTKGGPALEEARSLWARSAKADDLETALGKAIDRTSSTGSGANIDNATRQEVRKFLERSRGLTPDEHAAAKEVAQGTAARNIARALGKFAPSGVVSAALSGGTGFTAAGPVGGVMLPAVGYVAKKIADRSTEKSADRLRQIILGGGDKAALAPIKGSQQKFIEDNREALARALAMGGIATSLQPTR